MLVIEGVGPIEAVKRSVGLLKRTWGEQIAGNLSIGLIFGLFTIGLMIVIVVPSAVVAAQLNQPLLLVPIFGVLILLLVILGLISSTLQGIYAAAVYRFATGGDPGRFFAPELIQNAFRSKPAKPNLFGGASL